MKKYGDDADSFHDQGTRVEESKQWHETNQLRHDYSYHSLSKPKSTYKLKSTYKPKSKSNYEPKSSYSRKIQSEYIQIPGPTFHSPSDFVKCRKCGKKYDWAEHHSCPYCRSNQRAIIILALCLILSLIFIICMRFL